MPRKLSRAPLPRVRRKLPPRAPHIKRASRRPRKPELRICTILAWADAYYRRERRWPSSMSGPIPESAGDTWAAVDSALRSGLRGLPGGDSLVGLLYRRGCLPADDPRVRWLTAKLAGGSRR